MTSRDITSRFDPALIKPFATHVYIEKRRGRISVCFDHYRDRAPNLAAVEDFHRLGWDHYWNAASDAEKRRGVYHGTSTGTWVTMPLRPGEDPLEVATAVLTAWVTGNTSAVEDLTRQRIESLPPFSEYTRGGDMHVRFDDGRHARVWSYPKRGDIHINYADEREPA